MSDDKLLKKKQQKELQSLIDEITFEAKELRLDYEKNESDLSGSMVRVHENSPFLDVDEDDELKYSGSRWRHILKAF